MLGVCTHLDVFPDQKGDYNGWFCPCHILTTISLKNKKSPAPTNMEIPEYKFVDANTIKIDNFYE